MRCLVCFCFMIGIYSCSFDGSLDPNLIVGEWEVIYFVEEGEKVNKTESNTFDISSDVILIDFGEYNSQLSGTVSGLRVTNGYVGEYQLSEDGDIIISNVVGTLINEPSWTQLFNLNEVQTFEVESSLLYLYKGSAENAIVFERR